MVDATALGDALFLTGRPKQASRFYEWALRGERDGDSQAWLLYQLGNCLAPFRPADARVFYQRLLSEHPDSPWVEPAKVQDLLAHWYEVNTPQAMLSLATAPAETTN